MPLQFLKTRRGMVAPASSWQPFFLVSARSYGQEWRHDQLVNRMQHPIPTGARRKMQQGIDDGHDTLRKSRVGVVAGVGIYRPVDQKRPAHNGFAIHET